MNKESKMVKLDTLIKLRQAATSIKYYAGTGSLRSTPEQQEYWDTEVNIMSFIADHLHDLVLNSCGETKRLMGFAVDDEDNYVMHKDAHGKTVYSSLVGGIGIPLKPILSKDEYSRLDFFFYLNDKSEDGVDMYDQEIAKQIVDM